MDTRRRPLYLRMTGVLLALAGVGALVCGVGAWMVSGCCGTPDPPQDGYLTAGALAATTLEMAAYWCFARARQER